MYSILFVLDDMDKLVEVLEAWDAAGVSGATIVESTGLHRVMRKRIPTRYALGFPDHQEEGHYTLMSLVPNLETVKKCLKATEAITGDLSKPNSGVFTAWKVDFVKGAENKMKSV